MNQKNPTSHQLQKRSRYSNIKQKLDEDLFNNNWTEVNTKIIPKKKIDLNFIDLFSGAGGLSLGFQGAGFNKVASFEIDKDASATIEKNFKNSIHIKDDITQVTNNKLSKIFGKEKIDIICGGPPCQGDLPLVDVCHQLPIEALWLTRAIEIVRFLLKRPHEDPSFVLNGENEERPPLISRDHLMQW